MRAHIGTTIGAEIEYAGDTDPLMGELARQGWCAPGGQHSYHCNCETCNHQTGLLFKCQRDSTVSGEFITRILSDWPTAKLAFGVLADAAKKVNRKPKSHRSVWDEWVPPVQVTRRCGLHIHVRGSNFASWDMVVGAYLHYERWMQLIGSGPYADKREGMNITFLQALRERGHATDEVIDYATAVAECVRQVNNDRHVDLNYARHYDTFEFRVYNSTLEAWQMELAARLSVAFTMAAAGALTCPPRLRIPASPITTLTPPMSMAAFITTLSRHDDELAPLIERQLALYPERSADMIDAWVAEPVPEAAMRPAPTRVTPGSDSVLLDDHGALLGCPCENCVGLRNPAPIPVDLPTPSRMNSPWNEVGIPRLYTMSNMATTSELVDTVSRLTNTYTLTRRGLDGLGMITIDGDDVWDGPEDLDDD